MIRRSPLQSTIALALAFLPSLAFGADLGAGRITSVTPVDGGCVSGPTGPGVQAWDVEAGKTYTITISNVTECANGGTDATLDLRVNSSGTGNKDLVATFVSTGVYRFDFTLPAGAGCTMPIAYCTRPRTPNSGVWARRSDGGAHQAHLRVATFGSLCSNPQEVVGLPCLGSLTPSLRHSWGKLKQIYR